MDDHALFRQSLREHLDASGVEVVGEAEDGETALALAAETNPDVVLMEIRMQGMSSIDATRRLGASVPSARVLMLSASVEEDPLLEAISAGACGVLPKDEDGDQVLAAIAGAAGGGSFLSPRVAGIVVRQVREKEPPPPGVEVPVLTQRERQVLWLIVEGKENNEIAAELVISQETVKTHVSAILAKFQVDNRVQAAVAAVRAGLA